VGEGLKALGIEMDVSGLTAAISEEDPCGPDLEIAGDADFLSYLAAAEGHLPRAYFSFDAKSVDFDDLIEKGTALLGRSRDVRLVILIAKLEVLRRDLAGFAGWLDGLARLFAERWDCLNPREEEGDFLARMAPIYTLDDQPVVILPLQHIPLAEPAREGTVTFRAHLLATGEVRPRENEAVLETTTIERIMSAADLEGLARVNGLLKTIRSSLASIRDVATQKAGFDQAVKLEALPRLVDRMIAFVEAVIARRDPQSVEVPSAEPDAASAGGEPRSDQPAATQPIQSLADAEGALAAAFAYFERIEPSSPALLLIGQARRLIGKNLFEVLQILVPNQADSAGVHVGAEPAFMVPASALEAQNLDSSRGEATTFEPAETRQAALMLVDQAATFFRKTEPSSPIPLLLDRARALAVRDFLNLLKDLLPEDVWRAMRVG
jgi:type VI secretion system protein ImpA